MTPMWALNRREFTKAAATGAGAWAVGTAIGGAATSAAAITPGSPLPPQAAASGAPAQDAGPPLAPPDKQPPDLDIPQRQRKAGYAIVGLGKLALEEVMPAFGRAERSRATSLVSGHPEKARQVADAYGVAANLDLRLRRLRQVA